MRHGASPATTSISCSRRTVRRSTTRPAPSTPCSANTRFAKSIPTVVTCSMTSLSCSLTDETQSWHLDTVSGRGSPFHSLAVYGQSAENCHLGASPWRDDFLSGSVWCPAQSFREDSRSHSPDVHFLR